MQSLKFLWESNASTINLLSSTSFGCLLYHFNVLHQIRYLICILPLIILIISVNLQLKFSDTPFSFWILNPEMLGDYVFGLSDQLVTSVVFPYRELWCIESTENPCFIIVCSLQILVPRYGAEFRCMEVEMSFGWRSPWKTGGMKYLVTSNRVTLWN